MSTTPTDGSRSSSRSVIRCLACSCIRPVCFTNKTRDQTMNDILWTAVLAQMLMGGFDTAWHHEGTQRLAWRPSAARELRLHGVRNLAYAAMFAALGWTEPHGAAAVALIALMTGELIITLWDFVEEDRTRNLPATERVTHTLLTLNYGVVLALLIPVLIRWA